jgi:hypothetical protein
MCEQNTDAPDLARVLIAIIDEQVGYLRGAIQAANGLFMPMFEEAESAGTLDAAHHGLNWALLQADTALAELSEQLHEALDVARHQAGVLPAGRA